VTNIDITSELTDISIRPLECLADYHACEALQRRIWDMPDDLEVVPLHLLLTAHRNGGLLVGAFAGGELVGFVFGFPGIDAGGRPKHCSHMMGVLPERQSSGIGLRLKRAQRDAVLAQGLDLVTWTYDPLESRNAHLNICRLGAVCHIYLRDYYGPLTDGLNAGLPTDRFQVEWWLADDRVERKLAGAPGEPWPAGLPRANATHLTQRGLLAPGALSLNLRDPAVQVEIPADYQAIKALDPRLALEWRLATRTLFETYFAAGYRVVDFRTTWQMGARQGFYVLQSN
jgi:predicted GNAT superfamily acetyltransferase